MANIVLPERVTIQLVDEREDPLGFPNVIFTVCLFARHKNDFFLGPYVSNASGVVEINNSDLRHDIDATYDSGLMDYAAVECAFPFIEIRLEQPDDIKRALESRTTVWTSLLKGEKERWGSMKKLIKVYKNASNRNLIVNSFSRIRDEWDGSTFQYHYDVIVQRKA